MSALATVQYVLLILLGFVIFFGLLARKLQAPYPIVMVIGGLLLSFVPVVPGIQLNPDLVFLIILPPLLYSSAWLTSWRDFRYNLVSILMLAFGLVAFTVIGVALIAPRIFHGFDWRLGLALGAIVAPTDAIAATAIARRIGLPSRIVDVLEGESLLNDASGLLALEFALSILVENRVPTVMSGMLTLVWLVVGGIAIGLIVGWLVYLLEQRIEDGPIEITLSILVPYGAYLAADKLHASGVLAVVACGLFLSRRSAKFFSAAVRIQVLAVWESLTFILNGVVFVMIGLQLPGILASAHDGNILTMLAYGAAFSLLLISLRLIWIFPSARIAYGIRRNLLGQPERTPSNKYAFVVGWTGMRGVVSLAAALSLPTVVSNGSPFPQRELIIFLTFCVIVVTLAIQGMTLPSLIRYLRLTGPVGPNCEELEARRIVAQAALAHLEEAKTRDERQSLELYEDLALHYRQRLAGLRKGFQEQEEDDATEHELYLELSLEALRVERDNAIRLRDEGRINDEVLRRLEREFDLSESRLLTSHH